MASAIGLTGQAAGPQVSPERAARLDKMRQTAVALEANFLSEMFKHAGLGQARDAFGGGVGEEQFASLLADEYAKSVADAGGIGLAQSIFEAMQKGMDDA